MNKVLWETYSNFLEEVLTAIADSDADPQVIYPLLEANIDKLDEDFAEVLWYWAEDILFKLEQRKKIPIALNLVFLSHIISDFPFGNKSHNYQITIIGFEIILKIFNSNDFPIVWAENQYNLGNVYYEYHKHIGSYHKETLEKAIQCYRFVLSIDTYNQFPELWVSTQNNLSSAYQDRIKGERANNLELAIKSCKSALQICSPQVLTEQWIAIQINLGLSYINRIKGERVNNLELAIKCYQSALQVSKFELFPEDWARIQTNLGIAYRNRIRGERVNNLELALNYHKSALKVYTREKFPLQWATIQNNLGLVYCERIYSNRADNIEKAIIIFQATLKIYTSEIYPKNWADTNHKLGNAYCYRIIGNKSSNIEKAINCYQAALKVRTCELFPEDWAETQNSLGGAYNYRVKRSRVENLKQAICHYQAALEVYTTESFPQDWAMVQMNLGSTYNHKICNNQNCDLKQAVIHNRAALRIFNRDAFPQQWADIQQNLGLVHGNLGEIIKAINYFRLALEIYTPASNPFVCCKVGQNLGDVAFTAGRWQEAIEGYKIAIAALEQLRVWTIDDEKRQNMLEEGIDLYENIIQAYINNKQLDKAFEYVERSRCRRLVDLMASNDLYAGGEIPTEVHNYLQQYDALQQQIDIERLSNNVNLETQQNLVGMGASLQPILAKPTRNRAALEAHNEKIATLETEKEVIWQKIRSLDPVLAGEIQVSPPDLKSIQQLIDKPTTAILSFYTTEEDTYIFVVRQNRIDYHLCLQPEGDSLQEWIDRHWLTPYLEQKDCWKKQINSFLAKLSQRLQLNNLVCEQLTDIEELIIVPHLYLHQIPFAALPLSQGYFMLDGKIIVLN
ncbi:MAG: tetratricopeptide repeat protein [Xenococcaceae cyanobacterium MO_188.B29]|nr:tetratricopeptide repeat protein [Xenococcaceae cyanobacterium MO_188.B29]